jgi:hypothetical protein
MFYLPMKRRETSGQDAGVIDSEAAGVGVE